jgi:hypothetical protein
MPQMAKASNPRSHRALLSKVPEKALIAILSETASLGSVLKYEADRRRMHGRYPDSSNR